MTANDVMKTRDVTKNFNETLRIYLSFEELNGFFYSFTFNSLLSDACRYSFAFILDSFDISWL